MGRTADKNRYDLYKVRGKKLHFVGRFHRDTIRIQYGIATKNLKRIITEGEVVAGNEGKYIIRPAGQDVKSVPEEKRREYPKHAETIKCS